jgi:hypothetical protein
MYQVTAIYQDNEIGYGEGESLKYALEDCGASISPMFENEYLTLSIVDEESIRQRRVRVYLTLDGEIGFTH